MKQRIMTWGLLLAATGASAAVTLENPLSTLTLNDRGAVVSLVERETGRQLMRSPSAFVSVDVKGKRQGATKLVTDKDGRLVFTIGENLGTVTLEAAAFFGGWTFRTVDFAVPDATRYSHGTVRVTCNKWHGTLVNGWSDEYSAVVVRGYACGAGTGGSHGYVEANAPASVPYKGLRFGFAAAPRGRIREALKAMTAEAAIPHSLAGGAWSLGAEDNRRSYLMCYGVCEFSVEDYLALCLRGGFGTFHIDECWVGYGHYDLQKDRFPHGKAGLTEAVRKAHALGLKCDVHTLTASLGFRDAYVTPEAADGTLVTAEYTLAEDLPATNATVTLVVNEKPSAQHDYVQTYLGNGNYLRIGTEIVQYTGISKEAPWTFTGIRRGHFGTTVKAHRKGARVVYPRQRFFAFQTDPEHPLADKVAAHQGELFGTCGFDQIYLDGIDGLIDARRADIMARKIMSAAAARGKPPMYEDSLWVTGTWWFHSRIGANDYVFWGSKRSVDRRIAHYEEQARLKNFLEIDMGWWCTLGDNPRSCGYRLDEHEYFGAKNAGHDTAWSVQAPLPPGRLKHFPHQAVDAFTVLGWYERARVARAFTEETLAAFRVPRAEFRLRQGKDGVWRTQPVDFLQHRVTSPDLAKWTLSSPEAHPAAIRVERLDNAVAYGAKGFETLLSVTNAAAFTSAAAKDVTVTFAAARDPAKGATLRMTATNAASARRGAWARVTRTYPRPDYGTVGAKTAFGFWVKGDGSGALLNAQLQAPREYSSGLSEHYLKLDFTGWRYVEFNLRERDAEAFVDYVWPYQQGIKTVCYPIDRVGLSMLSNVNLYLNEIPAGGKAEIEVTDLRLLPTAPRVPLTNAVVTVNGKAWPLPFALMPREFAELDEGYWTRYGADGTPVTRVRGPALPFVNYGPNAIAFAGQAGEFAPRVRVSFQGFGPARTALKPGVTAKEAKALAYEAVRPQRYQPSQGFDTLEDLVTRPGETARVSFEIYGPLAPFELTIGGETRSFAFALTENECLACRDGAHWQVRRRGKDFGVTKEGMITPFASFCGRQAVSLTCTDSAAAAARIDFVKHYGDDVSR